VVVFDAGDFRLFDAGIELGSIPTLTPHHDVVVDIVNQTLLKKLQVSVKNLRQHFHTFGYPNVSGILTI
jgi:hypothetical protein